MHFKQRASLFAGNEQMRPNWRSGRCVQMPVSFGRIVFAFFYFCVISSVSPSIEPESQTIYALSTNPAFLPCSHSGFPAPSVYWTVTHSNVPTNITQGRSTSLTTRIGAEFTKQVLNVLKDGTLSISEVDYPDSQGHYQCTVVNRLGIAKGDINLTVVKGMAGFHFALYMCKTRWRVREIN